MEAILHKAELPLLLDLVMTDHFDARFISVLFCWQDYIQERGGCLAICQIQPHR